MRREEVMIMGMGHMYLLVGIPVAIALVFVYLSMIHGAVRKRGFEAWAERFTNMTPEERRVEHAKIQRKLGKHTPGHHARTHATINEYREHNKLPPVKFPNA